MGGNMGMYDMNAQAGMSGMMGGPQMPGDQMQQQIPQTQQMMPGGQQDHLAQQIRDTERQMAEMKEQMQMNQMPNSMMNQGYGGNMGGDQWEDESDSGSENEWWNQPVSYGQGMLGSQPGTGMHGQGMG